MMRWIDADPARMLPQEAALLDLLNRVDALERQKREFDRHVTEMVLLSAALDRILQRIDHLEAQKAAPAHERLNRIEADLAGLIAILEREE